MTPDFERRHHEHCRREVALLERSVEIHRGFVDEYERKLTDAKRRLSELEEKRSDDL